MGPEMMALGTVLSAVTTGITTMAQGQAQADAARAQQEWADRQAMEARAEGQRAAAEETRKAKYAQSRLMAVAGASGSGASDPTVMDLWGDIEQEGRYNAGVVQAMAQQRADGLTYQAALDRWKADAEKRIANVSAIGTILGGTLKAGSPMATRYGSGTRALQTGYGVW